MVGDSPADMEAGKRAGVKTCAVRYGYGKPERPGPLRPRLLDRRSAGAGAAAVAPVVLPPV